MEYNHNVRWKVTLNNNHVHTEGDGFFVERISGPSPFQKLKKLLQEKELTIKTLALFSADGREWILPSQDVSHMPHFEPFRTSSRPIEYLVKRFVGKNMNNDKPVNNMNDLYTVGVAVYSDYELQLWVNENNTKETFTIVEQYGR